MQWQDYYEKLKLYLKQFYNYIKIRAEKLFEKISGESYDEKNGPAIHQAMWFGFIVLFAFFGIFALWSLFSPLESAAVCPGKIIVATNRKTIQHLEGGIVKKILVKEGSFVKKNTPLIELEDTEARAIYKTYHSQVDELSATEARLEAERDHSDTIKFPEALQKQLNDPDVQKNINAEKNIFETNKQTLQGELQILHQRIEQLKEQIDGQKAKVAGIDQQKKFIEEELKAMYILDKKRLVERTKLWSVERERAQLDGDKGELLGNIAQNEQKIGETEQQIITLKDENQKDILKQLSEIGSKLTDATQKEIAAADVLHRKIIVAPLDGTVMSLQEHTIGGVIEPGKAIMDIVPIQDQLIVEARVSPNDIDVVHAGLDAKVQLTAYSHRNTPWLRGKVTQVSADIFEDNDHRTFYYSARIVISPADLKKLKKIALYPGMQVQVMIITEKRTPFDYFITPIVDSFTKAFRET